MKLIIDIPEGIYDTIQDDQIISREQLAVLQKHIIDGTTYEQTEIKGDLISRELVKEEMQKADIIAESYEEFVGYIKDIIDNAPTVERPHGECNQCRYYEGVHNVQGHAPCRFWNIGGVMCDDYCSRFEKEGEAE